MSVGHLKTSGFKVLLLGTMLWLPAAHGSENDESIAESVAEELRLELENKIKISGYTDVEYHLPSNANHGFRLHHLSLFFQKQLDEKWRFFSEIEYEDAPLIEAETQTVDIGGTEYDILTGEAGGKIFVEAVNIDWSWRSFAMFRWGRFFTPAGIWSVDHYPPFVPTQIRPAHIRKIFPQTAEGMDIFGSIKLGSAFAKYDFYVSNGEGNDAASDNNKDKAVGTRMELQFPSLMNLSLGGSYYHDHSTADSHLLKQAFGAHLKFKMGDLYSQTEAAYARFGSHHDHAMKMPSLSGYYSQWFYELGEWRFGYRFDNFNKNRQTGDELLTHSVFANYHFTRSVLFKIEQHWYENKLKASASSTGMILSILAYLD